MLRNLGFSNISSVPDGAEVLNIINKESFDIILMDIQMPIINGLEATKTIRALDNEKSNIPIIALTANTMDTDIIRCKNAGMNDHLAKPIKKIDLVEKLKQWVL